MLLFFLLIFGLFFRGVNIAKRHVPKEIKTADAIMPPVFMDSTEHQQLTK